MPTIHLRGKFYASEILSFRKEISFPVFGINCLLLLVQAAITMCANYTEENRKSICLRLN